jgi:hypothetical protein
MNVGVPHFVGRRRPLAIVVVALLACDPSSLSAGPSSRCTESGAQCRLADGPLGVCQSSPCAAGEVSPCFECTPQH